MTKKPSAVISWDPRFLKQALGLPEDCRICAARGNDQAVEFHIEHPDLPESPDKGPVPILAPLIEFSRGDWPNLLSWNADHPVGRCFIKSPGIRIEG